MIRIKHGFLGQRLIVLPFNIIEKALQNPLTSDLAIHSMGFFPKAENHYIDRETGCGEYLLIYCTKGEGWYRVNGEYHVVPENHFFVLPAEKPHQYGANLQNPWYIYWIHFKGAKAHYIYEKLQGVQQIAIGDSSRINDRISFFEELITALEIGHDEETITYANLSLNHLLGTFICIDSYRNVKVRKKGVPNTFFISLATHYMNENIERKLTLKEIASYFGYSESHIYRLFMKEINFAPMNYFLHLKIERACQLLIHTNMKINQITFKLGFNDQYYFSRIFTKITGMSPRKYKEKHREEI